jgi:uncharacterized cupredoxin-like copper-binding protein
MTTTRTFGTAILGLIALAAVGCGKTASANQAQNGIVSTTVTSASVANDINVTLSEFAVTADKNSVPAGKYSFAIANAGKLPHELLVVRTDLGLAALPMKDGNMDEEGTGVMMDSDGDNLDPGTSQAREVDLTQPGTYLLMCNLPGHLHGGMSTVLTVK